MSAQTTTLAPADQHHPHGRCPRVHLPRGCAAVLATADELRPRPETGLRHAWSMVVPLAAAPSSSAVS